MGLELEEGTHTYRLDGQELPSVSKIMEPLTKAAYETIPISVLNRAAERGTAVHSAIENYNIFGIDTIDDRFDGYFKAYKNWFEIRCPEILFSEHKMYHPVMMYAGTADLVCVIEGEKYLVDFKTSSKVIDKNYRVQLEAYRQALKSWGIDVAKKMVLHLLSDGTYEEVFYKTADAEAWKVFGALKSVYDYANK